MCGKYAGEESTASAILGCVVPVEGPCGDFYGFADGLIRAALHYPMNTGRMVGEVLRLVEALKLSDEDGVVTPEGWLPGGQVFDPAPQTMEDAALSFADNQDWYYRLHDQRPRTE